jgi:hypothetical protein
MKQPAGSDFAFAAAVISGNFVPHLAFRPFQNCLHADQRTLADFPLVIAVKRAPHHFRVADNRSGTLVIISQNSVLAS